MTGRCWSAGRSGIVTAPRWRRRQFHADLSARDRRLSFPGYTALYTVILNLVVAVVLTPVFRALAFAGRALVDDPPAADYQA